MLKSGRLLEQYTASDGRLVVIDEEDGIDVIMGSNFMDH